MRVINRPWAVLTAALIAQQIGSQVCIIDPSTKSDGESINCREPVLR
jgi:hypothetical protein